MHVSNGQCDEYIALSHYWGGGVPVRTTGETLFERQEVLSFESLPKSFQDAVVVTRDLGIRYLWIDALCIAQNDREDWEIESGNMAAIYKNAFVVIGADMSKDSYGGFLQGRYSEDVDVDDHSWGKCIRKLPGKACATIGELEEEKSIIYARRIDDHGDPFGRDLEGVHQLEPLTTRAWALQEQVLAIRMIHFRSNEFM